MVQCFSTCMQNGTGVPQKEGRWGFFVAVVILWAMRFVCPCLPWQRGPQNTPSQRNSQSVLFSCSLPPARFDLISPAGGQLQASAGFLGARCLATRRFQNGGCSFKIQPHSLTFTKISHHSSHLLIFGMLSPV